MEETNEEINHIDELLFYLEKEKSVSFTKDSEPHISKAKDKLRAYGLIENNYNKYSWRLTEKGYKAIEAGGFDNWKKSEREEKGTTMHVGNISIINGENNSVNQINNNEKSNSKIKTEKGKKKNSVLEVIAWIVGIAAGLVAIYEFFIK